MTIVIFTLYVTIYKKESLIKCAWPWPLSLDWATVKWKYAIRKPICNFPMIVNSNLHHICHRLRNNRIWTFEVLPTLISDLEIDDFKGHEKQRCRLHLGCYINRPTIRWKNGNATSNRFCVVRHRAVHTRFHRLSNIKYREIWKFEPCKSPSRSQILIVEITEATVAKLNKTSHCTP